MDNSVTGARVATLTDIGPKDAQLDCAVANATIDWIEAFDNRRHLRLDNMSPIDCERRQLHRAAA